MNAIDIENLSKTYQLGFLRRRHVVALQQLSLSVAAGQVYGLIGPNGAGKSTTIKILLDFIRPNTGAARLFGQPVSSPRSRDGIGYVPENPVPYEHLTAREYLMFQAHLLRLSRPAVEVEALLKRVELAPHANVSIRRFSKGMAQRTMLAAALLGQPKLIILDEPTSGLDPLGRRLVRDLVLEHRQRGATVLLCTHIISDVEHLCDRVALMVGGKLYREGPVSELTRDGRQHEIDVQTERSIDDLQALIGEPAKIVQSSKVRRAIQIRDEVLQPTLRKLIDAGVAIQGVAAVRFSLEDAFLDAVRSAPQTVGGELQ